MQDLQKRLTALKSNILSAWEKLEIDAKLAEITELEACTANPELWSDPETALKVNTRLSTLKDQTLNWTVLKTQTDDIHELLSLDSADLLPEISDQLSAMEESFNEKIFTPKW